MKVEEMHRFALQQRRKLIEPIIGSIKKSIMDDPNNDSFRLTEKEISEEQVNILKEDGYTVETREGEVTISGWRRESY